MADVIESVNAVRDAVLAVEKELGINPKNIYGNVRARLDILENRINNPGTPSPSVENPFIVGTSGITISAGTGEPAAAEPSGSLYLRSDGNINEKLYVKSGTDWILVNLLENYKLTGNGSGGTAFNVTLPSTLFVDDESYLITLKSLIVATSGSPDRCYIEKKLLVGKSSGSLTIANDATTTIDDGTSWSITTTVVSEAINIEVDASGSEDRRISCIAEIQRLSIL
jgi:hypothetical protein